MTEAESIKSKNTRNAQMSFLEFCCKTLIGPMNADQSWNCPFCDSDQPTLYVRIPNPAGPQTFHCYRCKERGDETDLLKLIFPKEDQTNRLERIAQLKHSYAFQIYLRNPNGPFEPEVDAIIRPMLIPLNDDELNESDGETNMETTSPALPQTTNQ